MLAAILLGILFCSSSLSAAEDAAPETTAQRDARMKWWREARFGMFIHWGVYSVPAGTHDGKKIPDIGEWIMFHGRIPTADYRKYAKEFNPTKYDAERWVKLAKEAGMKYIVITTKHHDGFAMFDSKASDWNIVKATPFQRDPMKELAAACQKEGIKLGFYYSQAQDWNHPGGAAYGPHWDKAQEGDMDEYLDKIAVPQVKEILSNYGPISVLWWDTPCDMTKQRAAKFIPVLKQLQPNIIMNDRLGGDFAGDTETPEQRIPPTGIAGRDWETCMTMNDTWGYKSDDHNWKSSEMLIRNLIDIASKGGNYLLNVGPTAEGLIPEPSIERLIKIGEWMKVNGESIYGTTASPFKKLAWGRCTKKIRDGGTTLYLNVFDWPSDGKLIVPGLKNKVERAYLLSDAGKKSLPVEADESGVVVAVPKVAPDRISSVVVLEAEGEPIVETPLLAPDADGRLTFDAGNAVLYGEEIKTEERDGKTNVGFWTNPGDWAEWRFQTKKPGEYVVEAEIAAEKSGRFVVMVESEDILSALSPKTNDFAKFVKVNLGKLNLGTPGKAVLTVKPIGGDWHPMNLRSITLTPAK
jgi:alpha-L-fucosidase